MDANTHLSHHPFDELCSFRRT